MGRMRKMRTGTYDRIGEKVNLDKCPKCGWHSDCFACMNGHCTALSETVEGDCIFYKSYEDATAENIQCYQKLKEAGRYDLIQKYIKPLTEVGALEGEILELMQMGLEIDRAYYREEKLNKKVASKNASPDQENMRGER